MTTRTAIIIPARLASTRLPEKLLRIAGGKSILQHTFEAASGASISDDVIVAVDDQRLADLVDSFGGRWVMTDRNCPSGTDRIAEVARAMPEVDVFVNVQGDEPEIESGVIDAMAAALIENAGADMATVGTPIRDLTTLQDPSCVKIVMAGNQDPNSQPSTSLRAGQGRAIYFSRAPVPLRRDGVDASVFEGEPPLFWLHLGLYAYRRDFLIWFAQQPPSRLEQTERLEQLRAVEAGKQIVVIRADSAPPGIDTAADLAAFINRLGNR